ncbi:hypothetical protein B7463_g8909, partial [Scytalidium lignicola]
MGPTECWFFMNLAINQQHQPTPTPTDWKIGGAQKVVRDLHALAQVWMSWSSSFVSSPARIHLPKKHAARGGEKNQPASQRASQTSSTSQTSPQHDGRGSEGASRPTSRSWSPREDRALLPPWPGCILGGSESRSASGASLHHTILRYKYDTQEAAVAHARPVWIPSRKLVHVRGVVVASCVPVALSVLGATAKAVGYCWLCGLEETGLLQSWENEEQQRKGELVSWGKGKVRCWWCDYPSASYYICVTERSIIRASSKTGAVQNSRLSQPQKLPRVLSLLPLFQYRATCYLPSTTASATCAGSATTSNPLLPLLALALALALPFPRGSIAPCHHLISQLSRQIQ